MNIYELYFTYVCYVVLLIFQIESVFGVRYVSISNKVQFSCRLLIVMWH